MHTTNNERDRDRECAMFVFLFVAAILVVAASEECPTPVPANCVCGQEVHRGDVVRVVRCSGLESTQLGDLRELPPKTELLVVKDSDLEDGRGLEFHAPALRILHLERNSIAKFDLKRFLCAHRNLERVYLTGNTLIWITIDPECSAKLRYLSLKQNHVHFLPNATLDAFETLDNLRVDLSDNTFSCDCNLAATVEWLQNRSGGERRGAELVDPDSYTCRDAFPEGFMGRRLVDLDADLLKCQGDAMDAEEDLEFYNYHSHVLYFMLGFIGFVALVLAIFTLYLHFPNIVATVRILRDETPRVSRQKRYAPLDNETRA